MKIFSRKKKPEERSSTFDYLLYNSSGGYASNKTLQLSTVYRCVEVISRCLKNSCLDFDAIVLSSSIHRS